jgi:hypothetical protein
MNDGGYTPEQLRRLGAAVAAEPIHDDTPPAETGDPTDDENAAIHWWATVAHNSLLRRLRAAAMRADS